MKNGFIRVRDHGKNHGTTFEFHEAAVIELEYPVAAVVAFDSQLQHGRCVEYLQRITERPGLQVRNVLPYNRADLPWLLCQFREQRL